MERYVRSFSSPDELIEIETVRSEMITKGGLTVSHDVQQPGWRWSTHVRPLVGTEWCEVHHVGILTKGRMSFLLLDGGTRLPRSARVPRGAGPRHDRVHRHRRLHDDGDPPGRPHLGRGGAGRRRHRGVAIHEASRMLTSASPGEILVSATTAGLAADGRISFEDRGEHELRGIPGPRRLFALLSD